MITLTLPLAVAYHQIHMYPLAIWPKAGIAIRFLFSMYLFLEKKLEIREGNFCSNRPEGVCVIC